MKNVLIAAVVALSASAGIASAESAGHAQLAAQLGLNGADFTTAELTNIRDAKINGDTQTANYFLKHENRTSENTSVSQGKAQLAAQLGVDASKYSMAELVSMSTADDDQEARFIETGASRNTVAPIERPYRGAGRS
ncbi:hypothetical protein [Thioclava sp. FTW29]|uniref:Uncharacterized protein n=1 Tax=Thioclava litoralis TaxID=3076557 RepID=A0ABZ1E772_9RHOB|nr:hypothetical protein RPE78_16485 [Thioclava sp. FTW29]